MEDNLVSKNLKYLEKIFTASEVSNMFKHFKTKDYKLMEPLKNFTTYQQNGVSFSIILLIKTIS